MGYRDNNGGKEKMNIIPFEDKIIVKQIERKEKSVGGLILTDSIADKPSEGKVLSVGSKVTIDIELGNIVLYNKYAGSIIEDEGEQYLILREEDIYGRRK